MFESIFKYVLYQIIILFFLKRRIFISSFFIKIIGFIMSEVLIKLFNLFLITP